MLYRQEYPGKKLRTPTLAAVICEILVYNRFPENKAEIHCVLFDSTDFSLGQVLTMPHSKVSASQPKGVWLTVYRSHDIVSLAVLDYLDRVINTGNIILVADDILYESPLNKLKDRGGGVILVKLQTDLGGNLYTRHQWGDISYPRGLCMGLKRHEL